LGGAALTRRYVEEDLRVFYNGKLNYANDAFDGLHFMEQVMGTAPGSKGAGIATVATVLDEMQKVHNSTLAYIGKLSDDQFNAHGVQGTWSVHDIVAHCAAGEVSATERIQAFIEGDLEHVLIRDGSEDDHLNKMHVAERVSHTRVELMKEWQVNRAALIATVKSLTDEQLNATVNNTTILELIASNTYDHERHHLSKIREWMDSEIAEELLTGFEAKA